jgi:hypothetical protein
MAKTMTNLTLKITTLLILTLSSTPLMAKSPWADEEPATADPSFADSQPAEPAPLQNIPVPEAQPETLPETQSEPMEIQQVTINPTESVESVEQFDYQPQAQDVVTEDVQQGDVLNIDNSTETVAVRILDFPRRGMTTDKVKNELGEPGEIVSGIGQPPISRWIYNDRTVYFEYATVLHVVAN